MKHGRRVVVVGGGMAGLAAAELLSRRIPDVLILDENYRAGGQLLRATPDRPAGHEGPRLPGMKQRGFELIHRIRVNGVRILHGAQALGIFPGPTLLVETGDGRVREIGADILVCATGAREKFVPFKGWTLPGVMSTGAVQIAMKRSGAPPAENILIGGNSPLMMALASEILAGGGRVRAVMDEGSMADKLRALARRPRLWPKMTDGAFCLVRIALGRVPMKQRRRIVEARGNGRLEEVATIRMDGRGNAIAGSERTHRTEVLAAGWGFAPNIELLLQAGCRTVYCGDKGGWCVDVNDRMETSVPDVFAAGEPTGIAGARKSFIEGRLAAWSILESLNLASGREYKERTAVLKRRRRYELQYGRFLNRLCRTPSARYERIPDEAIICRCEEVAMGAVREAAASGFSTLGGMKRATRCGMGYCQGRTCGPILCDILNSVAPRAPESIGGLSARAPVKAVSLGSLARCGGDD